MVTILFCNQSFARRALFRPIRDKIETLAFGGSVVIPPSVITLDTEKLKKFEGKYELSSGGHLEADMASGGLIIKVKGQDALNVLFFPERAATDL